MQGVVHNRQFCGGKEDGLEHGLATLARPCLVTPCRRSPPHIIAGELCWDGGRKLVPAGRARQTGTVSEVQTLAGRGEGVRIEATGVPRS